VSGDRARLSLDDFDDPTPPDTTEVLRKISEEQGFPSRPPAPPKERAVRAPRAATPRVPAPEPAPAAAEPFGFRRPGRPRTDRMVAINVRVSPATAELLYQLRDANPRQVLADVLEEAVAVLAKARGLTE
jgi:hypothetical protein